MMLSSSLYKANIVLLKYMPIILAIVDIIHTICSYYDVNVDGLSYFGGVSILTIIYLYLVSYCFKFCAKHRLPLHYVVVSNTIALYDTYFTIDVTDKELLCINLIIIGVFLFLYLFYNQIIKKCYS